MKNYEQPFDLIFSLGDDCACSYYLREFKLQNASYPLDWVGWAPIECAVSLIVSDFKDFLAIDSFEPPPQTRLTAFTKTKNPDCTPLTIFPSASRLT